MVDVDNLSDAELRSKLLEFGFPLMPITGTTRKVMTKKLKLLMENRNKIGKEDRRSLGRYSSEEESDHDAAPKKADNKYKRATMGVPSTMQPPSNSKSTRKSTRLEPSTISSPGPSFSNDPPPTQAQHKKETKTTSTVTTRTTRILNNARDEFDTGSESDEVVEQTNNKSYSTSAAATPSPSRLPTSFLSASSAADAASERLNQIRTRISQYSSGYDKPLYTSSPTVDNNRSSDEGLNESTPFLSNFTKRLSQLSESPKGAFDYKSSDIIKENDVNGGSTRTLPSSYRNIRNRLGYDYTKQSNQMLGQQQHQQQQQHHLGQSMLKDNLVPFMVLILAFLFFLVVGAVYLGIRSETALEVTARVPRCKKESDRRGVDCIVEGEDSGALNLLRALRPELSKRATHSRCVERTVKPHMTESDILTFLNENYAQQEPRKILTDLSNLELLTFANPDWSVQVILLNLDGTSDVPATMDEVVTFKVSKPVALIMTHPQLSWSCYLSEKLSTVLNWTVSMLVMLVILLLISEGYRRYTKYVQKWKNEEVALIENIIDMMQSNCSENDSFLVINHLRDMLLPVNERKAKEQAWARAVKYINENESRIRMEIQVVRGEPSEVWRWLGGPNKSMTKNKSWQGQAFETQMGSVNSLPCSPTPCLKIRGMVEDGDSRNTSVITRAVLSKCAQQCRILHVAVDTNSKCVYLKCADLSDAAVAYRNLHGWWYAGNLVTVKYLRLERYMQRFPNSPKDGPPFLQ